MLRGSKEFIYSMEGVTQGDPLSMLLYAVGMLPLIHHLIAPASKYGMEMMLQLVVPFLIFFIGLNFFFHMALILVIFQILLSAVLLWMILLKLKFLLL